MAMNSEVPNSNKAVSGRCEHWWEYSMGLMSGVCAELNQMYLYEWITDILQL